MISKNLKSTSLDFPILNKQEEKKETSVQKYQVPSNEAYHISDLDLNDLIYTNHYIIGDFIINAPLLLINGTLHIKANESRIVQKIVVLEGSDFIRESNNFGKSWSKWKNIELDIELDQKYSKINNKLINLEKILKHYDTVNIVKQTQDILDAISIGELSEQDEIYNTIQENYDAMLNQIERSEKTTLKISKQTSEKLDQVQKYHTNIESFRSDISSTITENDKFVKSIFDQLNEQTEKMTKDIKTIFIDKDRFKKETEEFRSAIDLRIVKAHTLIDSQIKKLYASMEEIQLANKEELILSNNKHIELLKNSIDSIEEDFELVRLEFESKIANVNFSISSQIKKMEQIIEEVYSSSEELVLSNDKQLSLLKETLVNQIEESKILILDKSEARFIQIEELEDNVNKLKITLDTKLSSFNKKLTNMDKSLNGKIQEVKDIGEFQVGEFQDSEFSKILSELYDSIDTLQLEVTNGHRDMKEQSKISKLERIEFKKRNDASNLKIKKLQEKLTLNEDIVIDLVEQQELEFTKRQKAQESSIVKKELELLKQQDNFNDSQISLLTKELEKTQLEMQSMAEQQASFHQKKNIIQVQEDYPAKNSDYIILDDIINIDITVPSAIVGSSFTILNSYETECNIIDNGFVIIKIESDSIETKLIYNGKGWIKI